MRVVFLLPLAGADNAQHYFVATQERGLRAKIGRVPGGASIFLTVNGVHLEPPTDQQKKSIEQARACLALQVCMWVANKLSSAAWQSTLL